MKAPSFLKVLCLGRKAPSLHCVCWPCVHFALCLTLAASVPTWTSGQERIQKDAWPVEKGLKLPADFNPKSRTLVFIHGIGDTKETFGEFEKLCRHEQWHVGYFDYPNLGPIARSGRRLAEALAKIAQKQPDARFVLVCHSMGGLVARYGLEAVDPKLTCVSDLFLIATPNLGSRLAEFHAPFRDVLALLRFQSLELGLAEGGGEAAIDLLPGSKLLQALGKARRNPHVRYHVVLGERALLGSEKLPKLQHDLAPFLKRLLLSDADQRRILKLIPTLDEIVHKKGDSAVSVRSARLQGAVTEHAFDLDHFDLVCREGAPVLRHILDTLDRAKKE